MNITNEQYLALSALVYSDISTYYNKKQTIIGYLIGNNRIKDYLGKDGSASPEFSALSTLKDEIIRDEQKKKSRKDFNLDSPELSALQNSSNPLRSFVLLDQSPPVIYRSTVTQRGLTRTVYHEYEANLLIG